MFSTFGSLFGLSLSSLSHSSRLQHAYAAAGISTLWETPSASPVLTFLPVLAMVWRTFSYESEGSATMVAVWLSRETSWLLTPAYVC